MSRSHHKTQRFIVKLIQEPSFNIWWAIQHWFYANGGFNICSLHITIPSIEMLFWSPIAWIQPSDNDNGFEYSANKTTDWLQIYMNKNFLLASSCYTYKHASETLFTFKTNLLYSLLFVSFFLSYLTAPRVNKNCEELCVSIWNRLTIWRHHFYVSVG